MSVIEVDMGQSFDGDDIFQYFLSYSCVLQQDQHTGVRFMQIE